MFRLGNPAEHHHRARPRRRNARSRRGGFRDSGLRRGRRFRFGLGLRRRLEVQIELRRVRRSGGRLARFRHGVFVIDRRVFARLRPKRAARRVLDARLLGPTEARERPGGRRHR